jgi:hypothetical protein
MPKPDSARTPVLLMGDLRNESDCGRVPEAAIGADTSMVVRACRLLITVGMPILTCLNYYKFCQAESNREFSWSPPQQDQRVSWVLR